MAQVKNSVAKSSAMLLSEYQAQSRQGLSLGRKQMPRNIACRQVCDLYDAIWIHWLRRDALQCVSVHADASQCVSTNPCDTFLTECLILATLFQTTATANLKSKLVNLKS